jgi:stress response protein YsnF
VPVVTEEVKVEKVPRVTEEVVIRTRPETEQVERDVQLRRERVEVEEEGDVGGDTADVAPASAPRSG